MIGPKSRKRKFLRPWALQEGRSRDKAIIVSSIVFLILSLLDASLTLWGLGQGAIEEVNPMMRWFIEKSPITFMAVKLSLPVMLGFVLWEIRIDLVSLLLAQCGLF